MLHLKQTFCFIVLTASVATSCKNRTWNRWFDNDTSNQDSNRKQRGNAPDSCGVQAPGARVVLSQQLEVRVRDAYAPLSLVQNERRYAIDRGAQTVKMESSPAKDACCGARGNDNLVEKNVSPAEFSALEQALTKLTLTADLRCTALAEVKEQIEKKSCTGQDGFLVILDAGRVIVDAQSCLPQAEKLWGRVNGIREEILSKLEK